MSAEHLPPWIVSARAVVHASRPVARGRARKRSAPDPLIADLVKFVRSYVVMSDAKLLVVALWIVHTHCVEVAEQTPYLAVTSPEKQCGKSRLLEVLELLVARPWNTILPSEAVVFRTINQKMPTLLLDETDTIFNPRSADRYEGLRALLNAGNRRGAKVPRCLGSSGKVDEFRVFCPKVLAGIGTLPDTVADRSIPIRLERRTSDEQIQPFRRREVGPAGEALWERADSWAEENADALRKARPRLPEALSDRQKDGAEILVAIADRLGYGEQARAALVELLTSERLDDQESMRLRLLRDIKAIFDAKPGKRAVFTKTLLTQLYANEEAGWSSYYNRGLDPKDLASLLKHYGIHSTTVRGSKDAAPSKGYRRDDFHAAWDRYLS